MEWKNVPKDISKYQGFVYIIKNKVNDKYYIGKKFFWKKKTLPPLKGKKNRCHSRVESDWKDYWGSCNNLLLDIEKYGKKSFDRIILKVCFTKFDCAYDELLYQIQYDVLNDSLAYNEIINIRLRKRK